MHVLNLSAKTWPQLTPLVQSHIINIAHRETGRWQASKVRLDVPPHLASAAPDEYAPLLAWLEQQQLNPLIFGSRRSDVRLEIS